MAEPYRENFCPGVMLEKSQGFLQVILLAFRIKRIIGKPAAEQLIGVIFYGFWHQDVPFLEHDNFTNSLFSL